METNFSVRSFVNYFKDLDQLTIPAEQKFSVNGLDILNDDVCHFERSFNDEKDLSIIKKILINLNRMGQVIAKTFTFELKPGTNCNYGFDGSMLELKFNVTCILKAERNVIYTRLTDLFRLIIFCELKKVEFMPYQQVVITNIDALDLKNEEDIVNNPIEIYKDIVERRLGYGIQAETFGEKISLAKSTFKLDQEPLKPGISIKGEKLSISLKDTFEFFSARDFRKRLEFSEKIEVTKSLKIWDPSIPSLWRFYTKHIEGIFPCYLFFLNQFLLPSGKTVKIDWGEEEGCCSYEIQDEQFILNAQNKFTISLGQEDVVTTLDQIGHRLIEDHSPKMEIKQNQNLYFMDIPLEDVKPLIRNNDISIVMPLIKELFSKNNPIGFNLEIKCNHFFYRFLRKENHENGFLILSPQSSEGLVIELKRPTGDQLIKNILNHSHSTLKKELEDYDPNAILFITFKAIFYHCCDDYRHYRNHEKPLFFKPETVLEIDRLIYDQEFTSYIKNVLSKNEEIDTLFKILKSSPEEFVEWDFSHVSMELKYIINAIRALTYNEIQGDSGFVRNCIRIAIEN